MVFRRGELKYDNCEMLRGQKSRDKGYTKVKNGRKHNHIMQYHFMGVFFWVINSMEAYFLTLGGNITF